MISPDASNISKYDRRNAYFSPAFLENLLSNVTRSDEPILFWLFIL